MIRTDQISEAQTGCCIGQASDGGRPGVAEQHAAGLHGGAERVPLGDVPQPAPACWLESTKALEMNVTGKSQISPPEVAASGVRTDRPISAPIQENA